jgi:hypothetical protein
MAEGGPQNLREEGKEQRHCRHHRDENQQPFADGFQYV